MFFVSEDNCISYHISYHTGPTKTQWLLHPFVSDKKSIEGWMVSFHLIYMLSVASKAAKTGKKRGRKHIS